MKALCCLLAVLASAAPLTAKEKEVFRHAWITPKEKDAPWMGYASAASVIKQMDDAISLNPERSEGFKRARALVPPGGEFGINIHEKSEAAANTKNVTVRITDESGKEIVRVTGEDQKPHREGTERPWRNQMSVPVPKPWSGTITVKVWNAMSREMWTYTVKEPAETAASAP